MSNVRNYEKVPDTCLHICICMQAGDLIRKHANVLCSIMCSTYANEQTVQPTSSVSKPDTESVETIKAYKRAVRHIFQKNM